MPITARRRPPRLRSWATASTSRGHGAEGRGRRGQRLGSGEVERRDAEGLTLRPAHQVVEVVRRRRTLLGCGQGLERDAVGGEQLRQVAAGGHHRHERRLQASSAASRSDRFGCTRASRARAARARGGSAERSTSSAVTTGTDVIAPAPAPIAPPPSSRSRPPRVKVEPGNDAAAGCRPGQPERDRRTHARSASLAAHGSSGPSERAGQERWGARSVLGGASGAASTSPAPGRTTHLHGAHEAPGDQRAGRRPARRPPAGAAARGSPTGSRWPADRAGARAGARRRPGPPPWAWGRWPATAPGRPPARSWG